MEWYTGTTKNLLTMGLAINDIAKVTGLKAEEIENCNSIQRFILILQDMKIVKNIALKTLTLMKFHYTLALAVL